MLLTKAFETCYEALFDSMKRYLVEYVDISGNVGGKTPLVRIANANGLLRSPVDKWLSYIEMRNKVVHAYGIEKADELVNLLPDFIDDAIGMYQTMTEETWD